MGVFHQRPVSGIGYPLLLFPRVHVAGHVIDVLLKDREASSFCVVPKFRELHVGILFVGRDSGIDRYIHFNLMIIVWRPSPECWRVRIGPSFPGVSYACGTVGVAESASGPLLR